MEIRQSLPPGIRNRFDSLGAFVEAVIKNKEDEGEIRKKDRLKKEKKQEIALLVFLFSFQHFLEEGSKAAAIAVEEVEKLGIGGFWIGGNKFEKGNENVRRGKLLADEMWSKIEDRGIKNLLRKQKSITDCIIELYNVYKRPEYLAKYIETEK